MMNSKRGMGPWFIAGLVFLVLIPGLGIFKFLVSDKTPLVILAIFIFLIMLRKRT